MPMEIDDELATYLQPGPYSLIVASSDRDRLPDAVRAWGPRVHDDRKGLDLFVGREASRKLVSNLAANDTIALSIANVTTYQALQLKGRCIEITEAQPEELAQVHKHSEAFVAGVQLIGISERAARGMLVSDVVKLIIAPDLLFDQTPGPEAGSPR